MSSQWPGTQQLLFAMNATMASIYSQSMSTAPLSKGKPLHLKRLRGHASWPSSPKERTPKLTGFPDGRDVGLRVGALCRDGICLLERLVHRLSQEASSLVQTRQKGPLGRRLHSFCKSSEGREVEAGKTHLLAESMLVTNRPFHPDPSV